MTNRGLGRGLGALLSSTPTESDVLVEVGVDLVAPNPNQPRKAFESNSLGDLAASIRTSGVIQPIIVRHMGAGYQLIAGERRWRAARQAGLDRIPAIVREASDAESLELDRDAFVVRARPPHHILKHHLQKDALRRTISSILQCVFNPTTPYTT